MEKVGGEVVRLHLENWRRLSKLRQEQRVAFRRYMRNGTDKQLQKLLEVRKEIEIQEKAFNNGKMPENKA